VGAAAREMLVDVGKGPWLAPEQCRAHKYIQWVTHQALPSRPLPSPFLT